MIYEIDNNIPIPKPAHVYPFSAMEIGDSFLVSEPAEKQAARMACFHYSKKHGTKYCTKMEKESLRIWRTE